VANKFNSEDEEVWRVVPSTEGVLASNFGRIMRVPHVGEMPGGGARHYETKPNSGVIKRSKVGAQHSYKAVWYRNIGNLKVHRLVCEAFHGPMPFENAVVLHINEDAHDNRSTNLLWGTQKENLNAPGFVNYCKSRKGAAWAS